MHDLAFSCVSADTGNVMAAKELRTTDSIGSSMPTRSVRISPPSQLATPHILCRTDRLCRLILSTSPSDKLADRAGNADIRMTAAARAEIAMSKKARHDRNTVAVDTTVAI